MNLNFTRRLENAGIRRPSRAQMILDLVAYAGGTNREGYERWLDGQCTEAGIVERWESLPQFAKRGSFTTESTENQKRFLATETNIKKER